MRKDREKRQRGITLVALVITIIIIIILSTVSMNFLIGENGLITKAQQAVEMTKIETAKEELEMTKGMAVIDGKGTIDIDRYFEILEEEGIIGDRENDVIDNGDGTYEVTTTDGYVFIVTVKQDEEGETTDIEIEYSTTAEGPRIAKITTEKTTNSIKIEVETRNADGATYKYEYKKSNEGEESWEEVETSENNTCTIDELTEGETYDIRVTVTTSEGSATRKTSVHLGELPEGTITFGEVEWQGDGTASVVVNTSAEGYQLQYQINAIEDNGWINISDGGTVGSLTYPSTVYARIFDGTNGSEHASVSLEDKIAPEVTVSPEGTTSNSVSVSASATDGQSGMEESVTYTYSIKVTGQDDSSYTTPSGAQNIASNSYTFTGLTQGTNYTVRVVVNGDKAGNAGTGTLANQTTGSIPGGETGVQQGAITFENTDWSGGKASVTVKTSTSYQIEYQVNNITEGSWQTISNGGTIGNLNYNDTVYARLTDGTNHGDYASTSIDDKIAPEVTVNPNGTTSNSVSVSASATDGQSGMATSITYTYSIKVTGQADSTYTTPSNASNIASNSYTFTGLTQGTNYTVRVVVNGDKAGNAGTGTLANQTTGSIPGGETGVQQGAITFTNLKWASGKASVTISTNTGNTIQYQVVANEGTSNAANWKPLPAGGVIGDLNHRDVVYARLTDGTNYGDEASTTIKDTTPPTISNITTSNITENSITVTVTATDNESGIASYTYKIEGVREETNSTGSYQFTGLNAGTEYTIQVIVTDRAGQTASDSTQTTTELGVGSIVPESTSYVGYYADVDGNGSVDGIIYADLAIGGSGQWDNSNGTYTIPKGSNFKKYEVSQKNHSNDFGTKDVIKVINASGNERFYVMALDEFNSGTKYCWYDDAYGNMTDYSTATSRDFGTGKTNTAKMIAKWNGTAYGGKDTGRNDDMWGAIQGEVAKGWFVPSRGEWGAFGDNLGITSGNCGDYGLFYWRWSSSQIDTDSVWTADYNFGHMNSSDVNVGGRVRLSATF